MRRSQLLNQDEKCTACEFGGHCMFEDLDKSGERGRAFNEKPASRSCSCKCNACQQMLKEEFRRNCAEYEAWLAGRD